jgi:hypothetical protein
VSRLLFAILFFLTPAGLHGETKVGTWSRKSNAEWWATHSTPDTWIAEQPSIHDQLLTIQDRVTLKRALANKNFTGWINHLKWLSLFPENWHEHEFFKNLRAQRTFMALALQKPEVRDAFLNALSPYDDHEKAAQILCRIFMDRATDAFQFPALAIAISLVFDQPFPDGWPHHFVEPSSVLRTVVDPSKRFAFFAKSQHDGALLYDLKHLAISDLKFVVDTPVPIEELQYVQSVKIRSVKHLPSLFTTIKYDMPRLQRKGYLWPHGDYKLFTIGQKGGLCVDQAYFTSHTAKSKGVPSIVFLGQGNSGEHAWLGYLEGYGRWKFDLAKFRSEDYPVGQAFDPQTWRRLTDSECAFLNRRSAADPNLLKARHALAWAELNPEADFYLLALQEARTAAPQYLWAWEQEAAHLAETDADVKQRTRFWNDWINSFQRQKDLRFRGEKRLLGLLEEAGETNEYNRLLRKIIATNKNQRFDLVVGVAAEKVFVHIENKRWEQADKTFRSAMQKLSTKAGGHLFYQLVQPYVQSCLEEGQTKFAQAAMDRAGRTFKDTQAGSILDKDLKELADLVKATGV